MTVGPHRVLVVAKGYPSFDIPGRGSFVADHVTALRDAGAEVVVASFETVQVAGRDAERDRRVAAAEALWAELVADPATLTAGQRWGAPGVPVARLPVVRTWGPTDGSEVPEHAARHAAVLVAFGRALAERAAAADRPFTVVHAHTGLPDGLAAMALASELGLPLVVTEHDSLLPRRLLDPAAAAAYRRLLDGAQVLAVSRALAERIATALAASGPAIRALDVLPNLVPLDRFPADDGGPRDEDCLLWIGSRAEHKGIETLLRATALARGRRPDLHLRLVGPASAADDARWTALASELGIADAVAFDGPAGRDGVAAAMRAAGLFVHPSPWETFGLVAAEAIASGLPVAATPSGGVEEIVGSDGRLGEIAAGPDPDALADAIIRLRDRTDAIDRAGLRDDVVARYGPQAVVARTYEVYDRAGGSARLEAPVAPRHGAATAADSKTTRTGVFDAALVVATRASAAGRVAALPVGPERTVRVVGPPPPAPAPDVAARATRRLRRWFSAGDPSPAADRRSLVLTAIRSAWSDIDAGAARADSRAGAIIVPADADDLLLVVEALGQDITAHLAPGSLRWLADRQDASTEAVGR